MNIKYQINKLVTHLHKHEWRKAYRQLCVKSTQLHLLEFSGETKH